MLRPKISKFSTIQDDSGTIPLLWHVQHTFVLLLLEIFIAFPCPRYPVTSPRWGHFLKDNNIPYYYCSMLVVVYELVHRQNKSLPRMPVTASTRMRHVQRSTDRHKERKRVTWRFCLFEVPGIASRVAQIYLDQPLKRCARVVDVFSEH